MIVEIPLEQVLAPHFASDQDDLEIPDDFDVEEQEEKSTDYQTCYQDTGFKQGLVVVIEDKNINFSKRPGYLTIDLDRREEPRTSHEPYFDDKGDELSDHDIPDQFN